MGYDAGISVRSKEERDKLVMLGMDRTFYDTDDTLDLSVWGVAGWWSDSIIKEVMRRGMPVDGERAYEADGGVVVDVNDLKWAGNVLSGLFGEYPKEMHVLEALSDAGDSDGDAYWGSLENGDIYSLTGVVELPEASLSGSVMLPPATMLVEGGGQSNMSVHVGASDAKVSGACEFGKRGMADVDVSVRSTIKGCEFKAGVLGILNDKSPEWISGVLYDSLSEYPGDTFQLMRSLSRSVAWLSSAGIDVVDMWESF